MSTREIWVADCETEKFLRGRFPKPFIWGAYNGSEFKIFNSTHDFLHFITRKKCIVYAHNGGKFDWHFVLNKIPEFSKILKISGRLSKFEIGEAEFRDSMNIIPIALKEFRKDDFDYDLNEPGRRDKPANRKIIIDYLRGDCVYLYDLVNNFITDYGLALTQASAAMKFWRKLSGIKAPNTGRPHYEKLSKFYYGGRVECFEKGTFRMPFKVVDINSAYPDAMMYRHPYGESINVSTTLPTTRHHIERSFIDVECYSDGGLPFRDAITGKLTFPSDTVRRLYSCSGWEFLSCIDTNTIHDYRIVKVYQLNDSIEFSKYVNHFFALKTEAKYNIERAEENSDWTKFYYWKAKYIFAKLFLNSLYGKYGSNPDKYRENILIGPEYIQAAAEEDGYRFEAMLYPWALCSRPLDENEQHYYNIATAASVTGFVRAKMWRALCSVDRPLYCDTDSIACVDARDLELDAHKLGAWDVEAECDYGAIAGKKLYAFRKTDKKWKIASKGAKLSAAKIVRVAHGKVVKYEPDAPSYSLNRGVKFIDREIRMT